MNAQRLLAGLIDAVHGVVNIVWVGGFVLWPLGFPTLRLAHCLFGIAVFVTLVAFGWKCPLTLAARYLRERADPLLAATTPAEPFVASWLRRMRLPINDRHITAITLVGTAVMVGAIAQMEL